MRWRKALGFVLTVLLILSIFPILIHPVKSYSGSWLSGYSARKSILVTNSSASAGTNYQVRWIVKNGTTEGMSTTYVTNDTITLNNKVRADFGDINYTDDGGANPLNYWIQNGSLNLGINATFYIKVSGTLTASNQTIFMYYGSPSQTTFSNGDATFLFFDEFETTSLDSSKWDNIYGADVGQASSWLTVSTTGESWTGITGKTTLPYGKWICKGQLPNEATNYYESFGLGDGSQIAWNGNYVGFYWQGIGSPQKLLGWGRSGSWSSSPITSDTNIHVFEEYWISGNVTYLIDNTVKGSFTSGYIPTSAIPAIVQVISGGGGVTSSVKMDWVCLAKYVNPQPTFGLVGEEEHNIVAYSIGVSSTSNYGSDIMYVNWTTALGLSCGIFGWNGTGTFINDSLYTFGGSPLTAWFNVTKVPMKNIGDVIQWEEWINDTLNGWSNTGIQNFTLTATITFNKILLNGGQGDFGLNGTLAINGSSTTYNSPTFLRLEALPNSTSYFINFSWSYGSSTVNRYNFTVVNDTTIYCYITIPQSWITASFSWTPSNPIINQVATFTSYSTSSIPITNYSWDFGDGNTTSNGLSSLTHFYTSNATFLVNLTVTSPVGSSNITEYLTVGWGFNYTEVPVARFEFSPNNPLTNETVIFDASQSSSHDPILSYNWWFVDSIGGTNFTNWITPYAYHTFTSSGLYNVTLTVSTGALSNQTAFTFHLINVTDPSTISPYIMASFNWTSINPAINETVTFTSYSESSSSITDYSWSFGDSNVTSGAYSTITHSYTANSTFTIELTVTSSVGTASIFEGITIGWGANLTLINPYILCSFNMTKINPAINESILFNATFSGSDTPITSYSWDFGDGNVTSGAYQTIEHSYISNGNYSIALTITSSSGSSLLHEGLCVGSVTGGGTIYVPLGGSDRDKYFIIGIIFGLMALILVPVAVAKKRRRR